MLGMQPRMMRHAGTFLLQETCIGSVTKNIFFRCQVPVVNVTPFTCQFYCHFYQ